MSNSWANLSLGVDENPRVNMAISGANYNQPYELPTMSTTLKGGAKVGEGLAIDENEQLYIEDGAITTAKLDDGAVTNQKLADGAVTSDKIDASVIDLFKGNVKAFDTVADMQAATLEAGDVCHTNGFHAAGDGGAAWYFITNVANANDMNVIELNGGLYAYMIEGDYVTPEQLGAVGYTATDWSSSNSYNKFDVVKHDSNLYVATQDVPTGVIIDNFTYWYKCNKMDELSGELDTLKNDLNINSLYDVKTGIDSNSNSAYTLVTIPKGNTEFGYLYRNLYFQYISVYEFVSSIDYLLGFNGSLVGVTVANGNVLENSAFGYSQYFYILGFDENNEPKYTRDLTRSYTGLQLVDTGYETAFGIWSPILENSVVFDWENILPDDDPNVDLDDLYNNKHTRTIFGYDDDNYYILAIDGRLVNSQGATFDEMKELCQNIGMTYAFNLDGGGSSQVWTCGTSAFNFVFPDNSDSNNVYSTRSVPGLISVKEK